MPQTGSPPSIRRGVAWTTTTFALSKLLTFASTLVLTHELAPSQFGVAAAILIVLSLIELTSDLGMKATIIYEQESGVSERIHTAFSLNVLMAFALCAAAVAASPLIAAFFHASGHTSLFRLAMLDIAITGLGTSHDGLLLRDLRFSTRIVTEILNTMTRAALGVALAILGFGASSLVWGILAGTCVWVVAQWALTDFRPRLRIDMAIARSMLGYAGGASVLTVVEQLNGQIAPVSVGRILGQRALGLYTVAFRLPTFVLQNIANQVSLVAFPALSRRRLTGDGALQESTLRLVAFQSAYALPLATAMAILARPIVELLFSAKWRDAAGVMAAVSILSGISAAIFALGDGFKASGKQRWMVVMTLMQVPIGVVLILVVASHGITAVAWAQTAAELLYTVCMIAAAHAVIEIPATRTLGALWPGLAASIGAALGAGAIRLNVELAPVLEVLTGGLAALIGALVVVRLLCPGLSREVSLLVASRARRFRSIGPGGGAS